MSARDKALRLLRAMIQGEEVTVVTANRDEASKVFAEATQMINEGITGFTPEELERARALMNLEPELSPRAVRTDGEVPDATIIDELAPVIEAQPLANGGPCQGDKCKRSSKGRRRAVWAVLDLELCDRCATRWAREQDGAGQMAIPKGRT